MVGLDCQFNNSINYIKLIKKITKKEQIKHLNNKKHFEIETINKIYSPKNDTKDDLLMYNPVEIQNFRDYAIKAKEIVESIYLSI